jgi:tetratricopeptide (TPR) repeat protein
MGVTTLLLIVFLMCSPLYSSDANAGEAGQFERHLTKGILFLDQKEYPRATEELEAAIKDKPEDPLANLYLGIAFCNTGKEQEGERLLKKALKLDPGSARANYELGLLYYRRGLNEEARDFFESVQGAGPGTELSELAGRHIKEMDSRKPKVRNWEASITTGIQYDSNVILEPTGGPVQGGITNKTDWRAIVYLEGKYAFTVRENLSIVPTYSFYQSMQRVLDDFNVTQHLPGFYIDYNPIKNINLRAYYTFEYTTVDYNTYLIANSIQPVMTISEGKGFYTHLRYRYQWRNFSNMKLFPTNTERNGFNSLLGVTQYIPLHSAVLMSLGYAYDKDMTEEDYWHYNGNAGEVGVRADFGRGWTADFTGLYYCKGYKGEYPGTDKRRRDITHTYSTNLTKTINTHWDVTAGWIYELNDSNIKVFDYERQIVSLMVRFKL